MPWRPCRIQCVYYIQFDYAILLLRQNKFRIHRTDKNKSKIRKNIYFLIESNEMESGMHIESIL